MSKEIVATSNDPIINAVQSRIADLQKTESLSFPANYSPQNALIGAQLILKDVVDKNYVPVLQACTKESIISSLMDMVVQGLSPLKKQGYFIAYGKQLSFQRSYFGTEAVVKRILPTAEVIPTVIHEGDTFKFHLEAGKYVIDEHTTDFGNLDKPFIGAYCLVRDVSAKDNMFHVEIMTKKEIMAAWAKARGDSKFQKEFPIMAVKRTIINRACNRIINTSDDSDILVSAFNRTGDRYEELELTTDDEQPAKIETTHGKVQMEVEIKEEDVKVEEEKEEPVPEKVKENFPIKKADDTMKERVITREPAPKPKEEPKPEPVGDVRSEEPDFDLVGSQKSLLEKLERMFSDLEISEAMFSKYFEKINAAKTKPDLAIIDIGLVSFAMISRLTEEMKLTTPQINYWTGRVPSARTVKEAKLIMEELDKL